MGNSLSPVVSNIFTEHLEEIALDRADHKPAKWLRYVDDSFVVWPHGPARLQQFLCTSTALYLPSNSQWKLKLIILFRSWTNWS
jgi:hypothetical protein